RHYLSAFFFQAEDGIRDRNVTGVQTCALPICSYDTPPPALSDDHEFSQYRDERYCQLGEDIPRTECLQDVVTRLVPYWYDNIVPQLAAGKTVLVVAHGNSRSEEHTSELQSRFDLVCRLLLEKKKK